MADGVERRARHRETAQPGTVATFPCGLQQISPSVEEEQLFLLSHFSLLSSLPSHPPISTLTPLFPLPLPPRDQAYGIPCPLSTMPTGLHSLVSSVRTLSTRGVGVGVGDDGHT